jgi:glyoxylate reductase
MKRRVAVLVGSTTDGGQKDGTGGDYSGTIESVDAALPAMFGDDIERLTLEEAVASQDAEALVTLMHAHVDGALLDRLGPRLRVVANYGVGVNHIDLAACKKRRVPVTNTPDCLTDATADLAWALLLACARRIPACDAYTRGPEFTSVVNMAFLGSDVAGTTLGVIGMGRIGIECAPQAAHQLPGPDGTLA